MLFEFEKVSNLDSFRFLLDKVSVEDFEMIKDNQRVDPIQFFE